MQGATGGPLTAARLRLPSGTSSSTRPRLSLRHAAGVAWAREREHRL